MTPWHRAPSLPVTVLLAITPGLAVFQFRAMALAVTIAFLLSVVAHWRLHRVLPWPRGGVVAWLVVALFGWCLVASAWSPEAMRGLTTTASLGALLLLGAMTASAVAEDDPAALRRMGIALAAGLALGAVLAGVDHASGNWLRRAVRGFPENVPFIGFGLKPAVSLIALFLPLALAAPVGRVWRGLVIGAGLVVSLWLPADAAKIAVVAGLAAAGVALLVPRGFARIAAAGFFAAMLVAPLVFALALPRLPALESLPRSAAHRVLIWDFVLDRIAERPALGWGMESSRAIPGGDDRFGTDDLARYGLGSAEARAWFAMPSARRLPLHTHNAALQVWLELGVVGVALGAALGAAVLLAAGASPVAAAALGAAVSGIATGQLSFGVWQPWWIATLLLAAVATIGLGTFRRAA